MPLNDSLNFVSTATSTGSLATEHQECPTAGLRPSDISSRKSKRGWMRVSFLTRFVWAVRERVALYLNTKPTPCYSNSDGLESIRSDIPVGLPPHRGGVCDLSPQPKKSQRGSGKVVSRPQDSIHYEQNNHVRSSTNTRSQSGVPVQTFLDVSVQLTRTVHWKWKNDSENQIVNKGTRFTIAIDPEIVRWLDQRKIKYRKSKAKIISPKLGRPCWEIFLQFYDIKDARYFALSWNAPSISDEALKAMIEAGRQQSKPQWR